MKQSSMKQSILPARTAVLGAVVVSGALLATPALAKTKTEHVRGTISAVSDNGFTVKTENGDSRKVAISSSTKIAGVVPGSLDHIKKGTFIGTANIKKNGQNQALEMVIFPPSMKGTGLGDYSWDLSPSDVNSQSSASSSMSSNGGSSMTNGTVNSKNSGSMSSGSSMTNGTVSSQNNGSSMTNGTVSSTGSNSSSSSMSGGSSMTNGTVKSQSSGGQSMTLKVNYGKGSKTIHVPANVPAVKLQKGSKSDIKSGAHVFVAGPMGSNPFKAKAVLVGINGTVPPM